MGEHKFRSITSFIRARRGLPGPLAVAYPSQDAILKDISALCRQKPLRCSNFMLYSISTISIDFLASCFVGLVFLI